MKQITHERKCYAAARLRLDGVKGNELGLAHVRRGTDLHRAHRSRGRADGYTTARSKAEFFEACDVVSLHKRLAPATRHIVKTEDLAGMRLQVTLVNTSRVPLTRCAPAGRVIPRSTCSRTSRCAIRMSRLLRFEPVGRVGRSRNPPRHSSGRIALANPPYVLLLVDHLRRASAAKAKVAS